MMTEGWWLGALARAMLEECSSDIIVVLTEGPTRVGAHALSRLFLTTHGDPIDLTS